MNSITKSEELFAEAKLHIPGGVNSPVRAFKSVGGTPIFMQKANGALLYDVNGNEYIDFINSWGPMILGHNHPFVIDSIRKKLETAMSFGTPTELEVEMARLIKLMVPGVDLVRLVSSGTEACMSALRVARGYTGRNKLVKFEGCYHGHADPFLVKAGSGVATLNIQTVPGVTAGSSNDTISLSYNDTEGIIQLFKEQGEQIAAVILEPVAGNMGCIVPQPGFLEAIRSLCNTYGSVLIFDEVMTGFRLAKGGAQEKLAVKADLITYGKVIGGGLPVGAFAGSSAIMEHVAPVGNIYQAGTLSGNPVALSAGYATLSFLNKNPEIYTQLERVGKDMRQKISAALTTKGIPHTINQIGSMMSVHFGEHLVKDFTDAAKCDLTLFNRFFHHMLSNGIYLPPSAFESWFISTAINEQHIQKLIHNIENF